jgi:hypothetical protein
MILVGKPEGKRLLGKPRHRWKDNIKMELRGPGWGNIDWIHLAQGRYLHYLRAIFINFITGYNFGWQHSERLN